MTVGQMTMYLMLFRQGQTAVSAALSAVSGLYEDNLYLSNLFEYLEQPVGRSTGSGTRGPRPGDGIRFEGVEFVYPDATSAALSGIDLHVTPGQSLALVGQERLRKNHAHQAVDASLPADKGKDPLGRPRLAGMG